MYGLALGASLLKGGSQPVCSYLLPATNSFALIFRSVGPRALLSFTLRFRPQAQVGAATEARNVSSQSLPAEMQ